MRGTLALAAGAAAALAFATGADAFMPSATPQSQQQQQRHWQQGQRRGRANGVAMLAGEVFPERTPGVEVRRVADTDAASGVGKYGVKGLVPAAEYKKIYQEAQKEHKKQANFPGFRAGKIPPGLMVAVREFSVVTAIETMALAALEPYELEAVIPPNGIPELKVNVPGDLTAFARAYSGKDDFEFDAEVEAKGEPKLQEDKEEEGDVVDVTAKAEVVN